ncbi:hypothetical protein LNQ52_12600 [Klebsiella pneumoniae subsp. pneumoniae]|nr:hypothetical protein [Klebsiella pneumoniae subsp. pneumoniae]
MPALISPKRNCRKRVSFVHQHRRAAYRHQYLPLIPTGFARWQRAVDMAAQLGADALIPGRYRHAGVRCGALPTH